MPAVLSNRGETLEVVTPVKITGVTITNESGAALGVSVYRFDDTNGTRFIRVVAADDVTAQALFNGMEFPSGFTVVPDTNLSFYLVEYEPINPR